jgi:hypothetical protein
VLAYCADERLTLPVHFNAPYCAASSDAVAAIRSKPSDEHRD